MRRSPRWTASSMPCPRAWSRRPGRAGSPLREDPCWLLRPGSRVGFGASVAGSSGVEKALRVSSVEALVGREVELAAGCGGDPRAHRGASVGAGHRGGGRHRQDPPGAAHRRRCAFSRCGGVLRPGASLRADTSVRRGLRGAGSEPAVTGPAEGGHRRPAGRRGRSAPGGDGRRRPVPGRRGDRGPGGDCRAPSARCCWWPRISTGRTARACWRSCRWRGSCRSRRCSSS